MPCLLSEDELLYSQGWSYAILYAFAFLHFDDDNGLVSLVLCLSWFSSLMVCMYGHDKFILCIKIKIWQID